ncbi:MAG: sigma-54 dependent transcriptional regulator [Kofleriaceae bacterium]|nr:sigma-54 dependent transcriptional regulator [Kofleriaceae bacterium]
MTRIAIVDDDLVLLEAWRSTLRERYELFTFKNPLDAERFFASERVDVALLDLQMPGKDGIELMRGLKRLQPTVEVVIMTGHGSIATAIEATRAGASDFVVKPVDDLEALVLRVERVIERQRLAADSPALRDAVTALGAETTLIGDSEPIRRLRAMIERFADSPAPVLVCGESGTGKELVARGLHTRSQRASRPFIAVNCAAIAETLIDNELFGHERGAFTGAYTAHKGLFEAAHGGVLFLDEIGDVPMATQVRLLRALQDGDIRPVGATTSRTIDVRVVAATNLDLERAMEDGRFRRDLYFRLAALVLPIPPLRDRGNDTRLLAKRFLQRIAARTQTPEKLLSVTVETRLRAYPWPGNVRELGNVMEYAATVCDGDVIGEEHLPAHVLGGTAPPADATANDVDLRTAREQFERRYLMALMERTSGNVSEASRRAGTDRSNLRRLLRRHGLDDR